jgi:N-acetylmuramoyl-L-alanine amidase
LDEIWLGAYTGAVAMRKGPTRSLYVLALALGIAALGGGLVTGTVLASQRAPAPAAQHLKPPPQYVVAIMPGHGGYDPGAISPFNGLKEKNVTLSMGLDLRRDLEAQGVKVVMTRTTDTDVTVKRAEQIARSNHADVLVSLWVNDWTDDSLEGATVFTPHSAELALAQKLSSGMAAAIAPAAMGDRGTQLLPQLWVHSPMPAVTIEVGFMSNEQDSRLLAEPSFRAVVAGGLTRGLIAYAPQIPKIDTQLLAYRVAEAKIVAAQKAVAARQAALRQMTGWGPLLLLLDGLLVLVLYKGMIWRALRRQAPAAAGTLVAATAVLAGVGGPALDAAWRGFTSARPRPSRGRRPERPGRKRPSASRPRRPPREWRGGAAGIHPRRVTEMVQPGDRRRSSLYDDFSV